MEKGLHSEVFDSQKVFRQILNAMADPGTIMEIDIDLSCPENLHPASGAILLTILDFETPLWSDLDNKSYDIQWLKFHTGAPCLYRKEKALFALCSDLNILEDPQLFNTGSVESPHDSTTLIIQADKIDQTKRLRLTGPGIKTEKFINIKGVNDSFFNARNKIYQDYPLGIDMIFVCNRTFIAIPRTSKLEIL